MTAPGTNDHEITLAQARELTKRFRDSRNPDGEAPRSHRIARAPIERILQQDGCAGLRIYHALKPAPDDRGGVETLVIVGVTAEDADLTGVIAEQTWVCPPFCPRTESEIEREE